MSEPHGPVGHSRKASFNSPAPNRLNTPIESGTFDEKSIEHGNPTPALLNPDEDEEKDSSIKDLIDDLQSDDGHGGDEEAEEQGEEDVTGEFKPLPKYIETDVATGLSTDEVLARRKQFGWNVMKEEKKSHIKTFLMFFVGPIQFVMEVRSFFLLVASHIYERCSCVATELAYLPYAGRHLRCHVQFPTTLC